jgi:hypothetical protein
MAIAYLGSGSGSRGSGTTDLTISYTCHSGTNRKIIVFITYADDTATNKIASVKYNGVSLTFLNTQQLNNTMGMYNNGNLYYLDDANFASPGAHNLVADVTEDISCIIMGVIEISGATQGNPIYVWNDGGVENYNNLQVKTTVDNTWLISGFWNISGANASPTSGQTEVIDIAQGGSLDNSLAVAYVNISPPDSTADNNWGNFNELGTRSWQCCVTIPPAIVEYKNNASIIGCTF